MDSSSWAESLTTLLVKREEKSNESLGKPEGRNAKTKVDCLMVSGLGCR